MAFITKNQVIDIIKNAPKGVTPQQVVEGLFKRGNTLEGYNPDPNALNNPPATSDVPQTSMKEVYQSPATNPASVSTPAPVQKQPTVLDKLAANYNPANNIPVVPVVPALGEHSMNAAANMVDKGEQSAEEALKAFGSIKDASSIWDAAKAAGQGILKTGETGLRLTGAAAVGTLGTGAETLAELGGAGIDKLRGTPMGTTVNDVGSAAGSTIKNATDFAYNVGGGQLVEQAARKIYGDAPVNALMDKIMGQGDQRHVINALGFLWDKLPDNAKTDVEAAADASMFLFPTGTIKDAVKNAAEKGVITTSLKDTAVGALDTIKNAAKSAATKANNIVKSSLGDLSGVQTAEELGANNIASQDTLKNAVNDAFTKAVRPSTAKKGTFSAQQAYNTKAADAVKTITENKDNLGLVDEFGEGITGTPKNLSQFSQAIEKTKKIIYDSYNKMAQTAGDKIDVSVNGIRKNIDTMFKDPITRPEVKSVLKNESTFLKDASTGGLIPEDAQKLIQSYNDKLAGFIDAGGKITDPVGRVYASIALELRDELDNAITKLSGPGYQELKNKYGALKTIEKDVANRALIDARKSNKGFFDITDVFTNGDIAAGLAIMNPALLAKGVAGKGVKSWLKWMNDPNRAIKKMFDTADKTVNGAKSTSASSLDAVLSPGGFRTFRNPDANFMIASAENPMGQVASSAINSTNTKNFENLLKTNRISYKIQKGKYGGNPENSFLIQIDNPDQRKLIDTWLQSNAPQNENILVKNGNAYRYDPRTMEAKQVDLKNYESGLNLPKDTNDFYSEINGKKYKLPLYDPKLEQDVPDFNNVYNK